MLKSITGKESPLKTVYVLPKRIVYQTEGVQNADNLLKDSVIFTDVGRIPLVRLSTKNGQKAAFLLDFGQEITGGILISNRVSSERVGADMLIRFGESAMEAMTPDGEKGACSDHSIREYRIRLPWNSTQQIGKTGFRFVYIERLSSDGFDDLISVKAAFSYRDLPYRGTFTCSDEKLNRIFDTCAYTLHLNLQEMLWDGVKRDRMVWIGDMHPEMLTLRTVFGYQPVLDDCLRYVAKVYPLPMWPNNISSYGMWYILILWDWYWHNGRVELIKELSPYWTGLLEQMCALVHADTDPILKEEELARGFFLDWPTSNSPEAAAGVAALLKLSLDAGARLCDLIKLDKQAEICRANAETLQNSAFCGGKRKQVVALMRLAEQISDEEAAETLSQDGAHGWSTFMSYYILSAIEVAVGMPAALDNLCTYYGAMLDVGATTFWEDFDLDWMQEGATIEEVLVDNEYDIHGDNGRFCYNGFRHSLCHGWSAGPAAFLAEKVLGVEIVEAGCKTVRIRPRLGELEWAEGTYPTPYGIIRVTVRKNGEKMSVLVDAPPEISVIQET